MMRKSLIQTAMAAGMLSPDLALAGMPSIQLTDIARMRLDTISFFLLGGLLSAAVVQFLWNTIRRDFPAWPDLSYRGALSVMAVWGLLSLLVLTMISGARELLTPGAWKKNGLTYQLADDIPSKDSPPIDERRLALEQLKNLLWAHAAAHSGNFPESMDAGEFSDEFWKQPGGSETRYLYRLGLRIARHGKPLVIEQQIYDDRQFVLLTDGRIDLVPVDEVSELISEDTPTANADPQ